MKRSETLEALETLYGRLLTIQGPVPYRDMTIGERAALLAQYKDELEADVLALELSIDRAHRDGVADVINAFRTAEGIEPDLVDDIVESLS